MDKFEFAVDESVRPTVERKLTGTTPGDERISALPLPSGSRLVRWSIIVLRFYRKLAPRSLRNKCVFEPSCSHYSELAFRQKGFWLGLRLTYKRLVRCRAGAGGIDYLFLEKEE
ncbi:membrane protein insertion efficiency factor YidD [Aquisalimonas asiatica]|uniref:membrane protein insertion efficiency factor YidD n=1 Tax=Aquisalimonas asiatica TaxID=406100 RepID=UPI000B807EB2